MEKKQGRPKKGAEKPKTPKPWSKEDIDILWETLAGD